MTSGAPSFEYVDQVDCLIVVQSRRSLFVTDNREEMIRADERGILIIPVVIEGDDETKVASSRMSTTPFFLADIKHIEQYDLVMADRELVDAVDTVLTDKEFIKLIRRNRSLLDLGRRISAELRQKPQTKPSDK